MSGRIYENCKDAIEETERELFEMGLEVSGYSYQDKVVEGNDDFTTKELQAYSFDVMSPDPAEALQCVERWYGNTVRTWVEAEFEERVDPTGRGQNPGNAWRIRKEVWEQFLENTGRFAYTYSERMSPQLPPVIRELKAHPSSRQAIIELHSNVYDLPRLGGLRRIPCSMFYQFLIRNGAMDCIYVMRSSDFLTHFVDDLTLAILLQDYFRVQVDRSLAMGKFSMFVSSLHAFKKDLRAKGIF